MRCKFGPPQSYHLHQDGLFTAKPCGRALQGRHCKFVSPASIWGKTVSHWVLVPQKYLGEGILAVSWLSPGGVLASPSGRLVVVVLFHCMGIYAAAGVCCFGSWFRHSRIVALCLVRLFRFWFHELRTGGWPISIIQHGCTYPCMLCMLGFPLATSSPKPSTCEHQLLRKRMPKP